MLELVPDAEFDDAGAWSFTGSGATVTGGQLRFSNAAITSSATVPVITPIVGQKYAYSIDVETYQTPTIASISFGGVEIYNKDGAGVYAGEVTPINTNGLVFLATLAGQWYLDRISIMATSIREAILQSLEAQAATITTANGYDINVATVERARRYFESDELPAVGIFDGVEPSESQYNMTTNAMDVAINMHSDALTENRSIHANKMLASLKKGILSGDRTHSGNASRTSITDSTINIPQDDDDTKVGVSVTFTVIYEEVIGDPYTSP